MTDRTHQSAPDQSPLDVPYLWDPSLPPDPEVQRLEDALGPARASRSDASRLADRIANASSRQPRSHWLAAAASMTLLAAVAIVARLATSPAPGLEPIPLIAWAVESLAGEPTLGGRTLRDTDHLTPEGWLETNSSSRAEVSGNLIGRVTLEPNSRLRLVRSAHDEHRMELAQGRLHAFITAPPKLFIVQTPVATAVDMGCIYDLSVEPDGSSLLRVTSGWVELEGTRWSSRVPAGYRCRAVRGSDPEIPRRDDAPDALLTALDSLQSALAQHPASAPSDELINAIISTASRPDAATVWHLLHLTKGPARLRISQALDLLVSRPENVTVQGAADGNKDMLEAWWSQLRWAM